MGSIDLANTPAPYSVGPGAERTFGCGECQMLGQSCTLRGEGQRFSHTNSHDACLPQVSSFQICLLRMLSN